MFNLEYEVESLLRNMVRDITNSNEIENKVIDKFKPALMDINKGSTYKIEVPHAEEIIEYIKQCDLEEGVFYRTMFL